MPTAKGFTWTRVFSIAQRAITNSTVNRPAFLLAITFYGIVAFVRYKCLPATMCLVVFGYGISKQGWALSAGLCEVNQQGEVRPSSDITVVKINGH